MSYKIAVVGVVEKDGKILIGKKVKKDGDILSEEWHIPGGKLDENETPEAGLKREIMEETGIEIEIERKLDEFIVENENFRVLWFLCHPKDSTIIASDDLSDAKFAPKKDIKNICGEKIVSLWPKEVKKYIEKN